ncbi:hypothetical protein [Xylella phage Bacata]|nr:hypothetical protein JT315_gp60 [Xylella phage Bacata]CAA2367838.1 hypothetical protein [Xylella phage Bacata]
MTTRIKVEYMHGNKDIEVVDQRDGSTAATLTSPGDVFEQNIHGDAQFLVRETGDFHGATKQQGMEANATVDESNTDANRYESGDLPAGAGDNGSNVEDVRVGEGPKGTL